MIETRPNITYAILVVCHFTKNLSYLHSITVKTIFYYWKVIRDIEIIYGGKQGEHLIIREYSHFNWAGNHVTKQSTLGFISMLSDGPVNRYSKYQTTLVLSLTEVEYIVMTLASKEVI